MKPIQKIPLIISLLVCSVIQIYAHNYVETFDACADFSHPSVIGWDLTADTNVVKITRDNGDATEVFKLMIHDSIFRVNRASESGSSAAGGAIYCSGGNAPLDVDRCLFENNTADWRFTYGNNNTYAGAILVSSGGSRIANTMFRGNRAHIGGALWIVEDSDVVNCIFF
jgi:hypothetical protein